jgi:hypothetical protein
VASEFVTILDSAGATKSVLVDNLSGGLVQVQKIAYGADDAAPTYVSTANPLPISDAGGSITVDGTVSVSGTVPVSDAGGSLTVDGTVAATQSGTWTVAVSGTVTTSGGLTDAELRASAVPISDGGGSLTIDGTVAVSSLSGVVNVRPASPAAADYLPVRLTDGTSFYSATGGGGGAGGQQYAEDAAHASGDLGTLALAVRQDTAAGTAGSDGDYAALIVDSSGRLHVNVGNTVAVSDGGGSLTVDGTVGVSGTVAISAASLPLPSGAATETTLSTLNGKVTAVNTGAVVLAAGTAAFGKLAANDGVDVGDVTINNAVGSGVYIRPGTGVNLDTSAVTISAALPAGSATIGAVNLAQYTPASGRLPVDGSGVTQPVSGTVGVSGTVAISAASLPLPSGAATAAKQPALGTAGTASADVLTVQGIASMTALKVDGSAITQPISANSLPLPTGASTAAKQPALGTAGSAASDVITIQGIASMTAVKVDGSAATQPVSGTVTATLSSSTNAGATAKTTDYDTGAGTDTVTMFGLALPASGGAVAGGTSTNPLRTDPTGTTAQPVTDNGGSLTVDNAGTFATQSTLQAGTALIGRVSASHETSTLYNGTTALTPKFATISASASGNTTLVAAVTSKKIRVLQYRFQAGADVDVKFRSASAGDLTGAMSAGAKGGGGGAAYCPVGLFETTSGEALQINLSSAVQVSGHLVYAEI